MTCIYYASLVYVKTWHDMMGCLQAAMCHARAVSSFYHCCIEKAALELQCKVDMSSVTLL